MSENPHIGAAPRAAGTVLDGREPYTISPERNAVLCRTTGAEPATNGEAHPAWYYVATQAAMGMSVSELCAACAFDIERGPLMVGSGAEFLAPLRTGTPYRVTGRIDSLTRKESRKLGTVDLLEYRLELVDEQGRAVVATTNSWILPRGETP